MAFEIEVSKTALLAMDYQTTVVESYAADKEAVVKNASLALKAAREAGMQVIYVLIGFRPGYPEVSPSNKIFGMLRESGRFAAGAAGTEVYPALAMQEGDLSVTKHRVSAFAGSDLEMLLRAKGITTLALMGISTSGVMLSTVRQAADMDFHLAVLKDACADADPVVHSTLIDKVFPRQADVMTATDFVASLPKK